jgi:hypothetical protein
LPAGFSVVSDERRNAERVPLTLEVHWEGLSGQRTARISDLSLGGCYIESLGHVIIGETIVFDILLPTGRVLPVRGEVVYHLPTLGFGVRFVGVTDLERTLLANLIDYVRGS